MPWIDPHILDSVVYLYPSEAEADDGVHLGGSGFILGIFLNVGEYGVRCIVTNRHVIESGAMVVRINTVDGHRDIIPLDQARWFFHPEGDDLAVCPIKLGPMHQPNFVRADAFINRQTIESLEIGPGDDVYIPGRFINHEGKQRNLPSVRFGNISQMPWEPIVVDGRPQESFLIEARSISGYSGSPVFMHLPPSPMAPMMTGGRWSPEGRKLLKDGKLNFAGISKKRMEIPIPLGPWLLGVDFCHIRWDEPIWSRTRREPVNDDWYVKSNTGMMGVIPAWRLLDIIEGLEMKPLIDEAKKSAEKAVAASTPIELDVAASPKAGRASPVDNPEHKKDFNRLLSAAVRKHEPKD